LQELWEKTLTMQCHEEEEEEEEEPSTKPRTKAWGGRRHQNSQLGGFLPRPTTHACLMYALDSFSSNIKRERERENPKQTNKQTIQEQKRRRGGEHAALNCTCKNSSREVPYLPVLSFCRSALLNISLRVCVSVSVLSLRLSVIAISLAWQESRFLKP